MAEALTYKKIMKMMRYVKAHPETEAAERFLLRIAKYWTRLHYPDKYRRQWCKEEGIGRVCKLARAATGLSYTKTDLNNVYGLCLLDNCIKLVSGTNAYVFAHRRVLELPVFAGYVKCGMCGAYHHMITSVNYTHDENGNVLSPLGTACTVCVRRRLIHCRACRAYHPVGYACPSLHALNERERQARYVTSVRSYGDNVLSLIRGFLHLEREQDTPTTLYFGVELEVITREYGEKPYRASVKASGLALDKFAILKRDGSLDEYGYEIVTVPATLAYHRTVGWNKFFCEPDETGVIPASRVVSWKRPCCGLHVHMSKAAMTTLQLAKLLVFMHSDENAWFLTKIAGRPVGDGCHDRYYRQSKKGFGVSRDVNNKIVPVVNTSTEYYDRNTSCSEHSSAATISTRNQGKTVEIRIFKGNVTKHGVIRALEFCAALVEWCGVASVRATEYKTDGATPFQKQMQKRGIKVAVGCTNSVKFSTPSAVDFIKWFDNQDIRGRYPDLWRHMLNKNLLTTKHKLGTFDSGKFIEKRVEEDGEDTQVVAKAVNTANVPEFDILTITTECSPRTHYTMPSFPRTTAEEVRIASAFLDSLANTANPRYI